MSAPSALLPAELAARVLAFGVLINTIMKLGLAITLGRSRFRRMAAAGLGALIVASGAGLLFG